MILAQWWNDKLKREKLSIISELSNEIGKTWQRQMILAQQRNYK
tara:strand:+ start:6385 stop:6516 length:132 start_codon:yes stop_codon:yes gene_type:complete